jgi:hypothetical protein
VTVGFGVSLQELVVGDADALESLDQQRDDISDDLSVVSLSEPVTVQFPTVLKVYQARPKLVMVRVPGLNE